MMRTRRAVHLWEWAAEGTGTGFVLFCTLTVIYGTGRIGSTFLRGTQSTSLRFLVIGVVAASSAAAVAYSPIGRLSGAHLNPAVTVALWLQRHVYPVDLIGYVVADVNGALSSVIVGPSGPQVAWTLALRGGAGSTFGSPAIEPDGTVITTVGRQVVAVADRGDTGHVMWRYMVGAAIEVSPAIGPDGTVVVGTNDPYQYGLSPTGKLRWKIRRESETYSSTSVTHDGLAYYGDNNGVVYGVRAATGVPVVRYQGVQGVWSIPVIDGGHCVYFGTQGGNIYGFTFQGTKLFDINAHAPIDSYPAITGDGTLVIGTEKGVLYAIHG